MKSKYVMIKGFAFSEEEDMERLKEYAREGWILEGISGGLFYRLRKDKPQDIVYTLDYQPESNEEYFDLFKEAGWDLVVSSGSMHIFTAQAGTTPIYSDGESEIDKYESVKNQTGKGTLYSSIIGIVLLGLWACSAFFFRPAYRVISLLLVMDIIVFIFNFMPYLAYKSRINEIHKNGKFKSQAINKTSWITDAILGVVWLALGGWYIERERVYLGGFFMIFGAVIVLVGVCRFMKYKKSLS